jgi:hypothetical protein
LQFINQLNPNPLNDVPRELFLPSVVETLTTDAEFLLGPSKPNNDTGGEFGIALSIRTDLRAAMIATWLLRTCSAHTRRAYQ